MCRQNDAGQTLKVFKTFRVSFIKNAQMTPFWRLLMIVALTFTSATAVTPAHAEACGATYTVRPGDTLYGVARRCGVSAYDLIMLNRLADPNLIQIGQILNLVGPTTIPNLQQKGLAMAQPQYLEDLQTLGTTWHYAWVWCEREGCLPMVGHMELPPSCPPVLLVGNEPNAIEPWGRPIPPEDAVNRVLAIEQHCPDTRLVVGNVAADDWSVAEGWGRGADWLRVFLAGYYWATGGQPFAQILGVHCYAVRVPHYCIRQLAEMRALYAGEMWVTEFGLLGCVPATFTPLLNFVANNFSHYAAYTNRQPHTGEGWETSTSVELVQADGRLSACGEVYARR